MHRVPVMVRAIVIGIVVTGAGTLPWGILVKGNLRAGSQVPWAAAVMAIYLFWYVKYLRGWGWPRSTAATRRDSLRATRLPLPVWGWSLLAGASSSLASVALLLVVRRLVAWPVPADEFPARLPALVIFVTLLLSAAVAGVSEEAGFRGYMQRPMERRYGPTIAILVSSIVFGLAHVSHGWRAVPLAFDAGWGCLYGILAYFSGSILPGIVFHSGLDFIEFLVAWKHPLSPRPLVWQSGSDAQFWGNCAATVILALVAVWAFRRLATVARAKSQDATTGEKN